MSGFLDRVGPVGRWRRAARLVAASEALQAEFDQLHHYRDVYGAGVDELVALWSPTTFPPAGLDHETVFGRIEKMLERTP